MPAMAIAPTIGIYLYQYTGSFEFLFWLALIVAFAGMAVDATVSLPQKAIVMNKSKLSLDRFFLTHGWLIGVNMIREALSNEEESLTSSLAFLTMLKLAIATSIDALAVGVSLSLLQDTIVLPAMLIGLTTFTISAIGVSFGKYIGEKFSSKAEIAGGIVLILLGVKILLEHTLLK